MKFSFDKPLLGYGTYKITNCSVTQFKQLLATAYDCGYDFIDTASYYFNHQLIGAALCQLRNERGANFSFPVQTKIWPGDYLQVSQFVHQALIELQLPYLNCVLLHRPSYDFATDLYAWKQLVKLQEQNLIKTIGVSNYDAEMVYLLTKYTNVAPACNQIQFNLYNTRVDRYLTNQTSQIHLQAWRPLTNDIKQLQTDKLVQKIANKHQTTPTGIALAYLKALKITPIPKSVNPDRIKANAFAFQNVFLDETDLKELQNLNHYFNASAPASSATYPLSDQKLLESLFVKANKLNVEND